MPRSSTSRPHAHGLPGVARGNAGRYGLPVLIFIVTATLFSLVLHYPFLNWDDGDVFVRNQELRGSGLVTWAFTTRYMEHYQPLAWLSWGALERTVGLTPHNAHALSLVLHALCAVVVYVLIRAGLKAGPDIGRRHWIAALAASFWALHPLRVEVVAWASGMPYSLALLFALLSMIAWLAGKSRTAVGLFALSLLARPIAMLLPVMWVVVGPAKGGPHDRQKAMPHDRENAGAHDIDIAGLHYSYAWRPALAGLALAVFVALAESSARLSATLAEFGVGPRLTLAASAPWRYLWRTIAPFNLTPLDPLALTPRTDVMTIALGFAATAVASLAAWRWRREYPVLALSWLAYLALLAPAMGIVPSGLQATADRYTYFAAVPLSVAFAGLMLASPARAGLKTRAYTWRAAVAGALVLLLAVLAWRQVQHWRDSIALWTRAIEIDSRNDLALYNLGTALDEAGRSGEALTAYERVLALVPDHADARRNLNLLRARQLEDEGNRLAAAGSLAEAVTRYTHAVQLDPRRTHSHAALGMALTQLGRIRDARVHLQIALDQGVNDPAIPNALAFGLVQTGDREGARAVLQAAQRRFPNDVNIARNLALLQK